MKNPIKSMSGNMWAALRKLRISAKWTQGYTSTCEALHTRGLIEFPPAGRTSLDWQISDLGRMVCDAFTEGQESVR